jgi:uncharacterized membrane protein
MAGIGFELRRLTAKRNYMSMLHAYLSAAIISAGPWIISIISLMVLTFLLHRMLSPDDIRLFTSTTTHVYAFALILAGPVQLVLTRYVSDCFSMKKPGAVYPSFIGALIVTTLLAAVAGGAFFMILVQASPLYRVMASALCVYVACIFIASTYLSALQEYNRIVLAFFAGYIASIGCAYVLAWTHGVTGALAGFLAGQFVLFALLALQVQREFGRGGGSWFAFLRAFAHFPELMLCGLFYNLGIWADKFLFWWLSKSSVQIAGALHAAPDYDLAIYMSLLSITPGMAIFFLQVETAFAERYKCFFDAVNNGRSLSEIAAARRGIVVSLREGFDRLLKVQGLTTAVLVIFADKIGGWFHIGYVQTGIFRITLFGALLLVVFLSMLTVLFYFDDRRGALICSFVFLMANTLLSAATLMNDEIWYGFGFVVANALALFIATTRVNRRIEDLEFNTFCRSDR